MNLSTTYLGMNLRSPLVVSASPLSESVDNVKRLEEAGASAIVLFSLFEEQIRTTPASLSGIQTRFPYYHKYHVDPEKYLTHIRKCKEAVNIPIIASINCRFLGKWVEFLPELEQAGADALELNIYFMPTDIDMSAEHAESEYIYLLKAVKSRIKRPVAVKLTPFFTNIVHVARRLDQAGANALVLFNRFYQPDLAPETLKFRYEPQYSTSQDSLLAMHWIAIVRHYLRADLAATGGVHTARDVAKLLMVGAKVTMLASALLKEGIPYLRTLEQNLREWMDQNLYRTVADLQGASKRFDRQDLTTFEREEYIDVITFFRPEARH